MDQEDVAACRGAAGRLWCPFDARMNPEVERAHAACRAWGRSAGLLADERAMRRFEAAAYTRLTARAYPTAALDELTLVAEWNLWLFVHDDGCDAGPTGREPERLVALYDDLRAILHGQQTHHTSAAARALADLVARIFDIADDESRERFLHAVDAYFTACVWEAHNRVCGRVPTLAQYIEMRRDTGAVRTSIAMVEICERIQLPAHIIAQPHVEALANACNDVVCWANDIISLPKEHAEGDVHNLVAVLAHHHCAGDIAQATELAIRMHDARVADFIRFATSRPLVDPELHRFVDTMRAWMRGNLDWARESGRYAAGLDAREEIAPHRVAASS